MRWWFVQFLFLIWWKHQTHTFSLLVWNYVFTNFKILLVTRFKHPKRWFWHWKCIQEATCDSVKSYSKLPLTNLFLRIFPATNERSALENIVQSQRREFWGGFQYAFSKLVSNFKEACIIILNLASNKLYTQYILKFAQLMFSELEF